MKTLISVYLSTDVLFDTLKLISQYLHSLNHPHLAPNCLACTPNQRFIIIVCVNNMILVQPEMAVTNERIFKKKWDHCFLLTLKSRKTTALSDYMLSVTLI